MTVAAFAARLDRELATLATEIGTNAYRPGPLRRVAIPKADGGTRMLAIPCIRDRVAQGAALFVLQPALEARQSVASFAYRPARGVDDAIAAVRHAHDAGLVWTLEADITACFDSISHQRLIAELAIWLESEPVLRLLALWVHGFSATGYGVAQGAPIAPLLANLYLHPLDRLLAAAGYVPVRYADDFVILAAGAAAVRRARQLAESVLQERGLQLRADKTRTVPPGTPFRFLGQMLCAGQQWIAG